MRRWRILTAVSAAMAILLGSAVPAVNQAARSGQQPQGAIRGRVEDASRGVHNVKVLVESATAKHEAVTDTNGDYEIELPAGVYTITATIPEYYPYRRAPFRVRPGTVTTINLDLLLIGIDRVHGGGKGIHYEKLPLPHAADNPLDVLVVYEDRKESERYVEYEGIKLYFDALAVHAVNFQLDKKDFTFKATGNVHVDDGHQSDVYVRQADISFLGGSPQIQLTFGAVDRVSGKGSIDNNNVTFDFEVEKDKAGRLTYQDKQLGISFSAGFYSFGVVDDEANEVQFDGFVKANVLMGKEEVPGRYYAPIDFTVTVKDTGNVDTDAFSIMFHSVPIVKRSGTLSKGTIEVHRRY